MANLRIVNDNVADDYLSLTATSSSGTLVPTNLVQDLKSKVWRGTSLTETLTVTWDNTQLISMVALPFCNFSSTSTIRVKLYTNVADTVPALDTGAVLSNPYTIFDELDWGNVPLGVNAYYYGGGTYAVTWFATQSVKKIEVILDDSSNVNTSFLEASRLVTGTYWSPSINVDYGATLQAIDKSKHYRNESGDLVSNRGISFKKMTMKLSNMSAADRNQFMSKMQANGKFKPFYISLFPESLDAEEEQNYQIYGKLPSLKSIARASFERSKSGITIEEI
jgi:hypothetical protein